MNTKLTVFGILLVLSSMWIMPIIQSMAAEPIIIGVPTSLGFLKGKEAHKAVQIAVSEINAKGGANVAGSRRPLRAAAADLRDASPGIPTTEALLRLKKHILGQKPTAIVVD